MLVITFIPRLTQSHRAGLSRVEERLLENDKAISDLKAQSEANHKRLTERQETFRIGLATASKAMELDTTKLLHTCAGISVGVQRLDRRYAELEDRVTLGNPDFVRNQKRCMAVMSESSTLLRTYAARTGKSVGQILELQVRPPERSCVLRLTERSIDSRTSRRRRLNICDAYSELTQNPLRQSCYIHQADWRKPESRDILAHPTHSRPASSASHRTITR
jgi:vacuolar-type H+-ATPase subunit I/STV1